MVFIAMCVKEMKAGGMDHNALRH